MFVRLLQRKGSIDKGHTLRVRRESCVIIVYWPFLRVSDVNVEVKYVLTFYSFPTNSRPEGCIRVPAHLRNDDRVCSAFLPSRFSTSYVQTFALERMGVSIMSMRGVFPLA